MFQTKRSTQEIDTFIKNLSLDVAKILLNATVKKPAVRPASFALSHSTGIVVLNHHHHSATTADFSIPTARNLVEMVSAALVRVLKKINQAKDSIYSLKNTDWAGISASLNCLSLLKQGNVVENLVTENERSAFFINLYNLLFIHSLVDAKTTLTETGQGDVAQRVHFWRYCYEIAPWGLVSLQDLFDDFSPFQHRKESTRFGVTRLKENGFLMANSDHRTAVCVLHGQMFEQQVALAVSQYLTRTTWYDAKKKVVRLPTWLFRIYPADRLMALVRKGWIRSGEVDFAEAILEPSGRLIRDVGFR
jgi:Protein of unknown function, DUF547